MSNKKNDIEWFESNGLIKKIFLPSKLSPSFQVIKNYERHVTFSDQIRFGAVCSRWFVVVGKISKQETEAADEKVDYKIVKQFRGKAGDHNKAIIQSGKHEKIFLNQSVKYKRIWILGLDVLELNNFYAMWFAIDRLSIWP